MLKQKNPSDLTRMNILHGKFIEVKVESCHESGTLDAQFKVKTPQVV